MAHDAIISYSSKDKLQADAICNRLESNGIRCWIAPRDVPLGTEYADSIVEAIEGSKVLVLVFSTHANDSHQVRREVERAVSKGLTIVPVRIEAAQMSKSFELYVSSMHWLDAMTPPLEQHIDKLARDLRSLLSGNSEAVAERTPGPVAGPGSVGDEAEVAPLAGATANAGVRSSRRNLVYLALGALALVIASWLLIKGGPDVRGPQPTEATSQPADPSDSSEPAGEAPPFPAVVEPPRQSEPPQRPEARFEATPVIGLAPLTVSFSDRSTGQIESREWQFGDGRVTPDKDSVNVYTRAGRYSVVLTVRGPGGPSTAVREDLITVGEKPATPTTRQQAIDECMATYSRYGQCDWGHWSEMVERCALYNFKPLDDEATIAKVKAGACAWRNWSEFAAWSYARVEQ